MILFMLKIKHGIINSNRGERMKLKIAHSCLLILLIISGCSTHEQYPSDMPDSPAPLLKDVKQIEIVESMVVTDQVNAIVDYSNSSLGYICAKRMTQDDVKIKLQVVKDNETYNYDILNETYTPFPLQMGNGDYTLKIMRQVKDNSYALMTSMTIQVQLQNELYPYLYPNQIVAFTPDSAVVQKAFEITQHDKNDIQRIYSIYEYVVNTIRYDDERALAVANQFVLPDIDRTLETNEGICFDYAALLAAMLRSQQIPTRLITGYTEKEYHSWVEIWMEDEGWIDPHIYFSSEEWSLIDPTYAASKIDYEGAYEKKFIY